MTRIGAHSTRPRVDFSGSVDLGWRVEPLPSRVGLRARVAERRGTGLLERGTAKERLADTRAGADTTARDRG